MEAVIFILAPIIILLFAAVVRVLGTNIGYKVLLGVILIYFVIKW